MWICKCMIHIWGNESLHKKLLIMKGASQMDVNTHHVTSGYTYVEYVLPQIQGLHNFKIWFYPYPQIMCIDI